jgi:enamine deaminase RidA (YjgF/YER057c/UK114 family)
MVERISQGSSFEEDMSYSRAIVDGDWIFVSGTTGFNYSTMTISDDVAEQADACFQTIAMCLEMVGASLKNVVRVRYILPNVADFPACWPVMRLWLGETRPAATMFSAGLADPRMKIEIEVTARKGN